MKSMLNWAALTLFVVNLTVLGCAPPPSPTLRIKLPQPMRHPCPPQAFQVGAAKVDITPMPGYAMGGHGPGGTISRGYWLRLYARAVYMEDDLGQSLTFVSCDLWSMPGGLADRVAELVHEKLPHLGREQIILAATHTHQSPGNFSTAKTFNDLGSRLAGFDRPLFDFLAKQITRSIEVAYDNRKPCTVFHRKTAPIAKLFRNRSVEAFALNLDSDDVTGPNKIWLPIGNAPKELRSEASYHAVDARVSTLRFVKKDDPQTDKSGETIALLAFVAVHPEAMSAETQVYSSDLLGVAAITVEQRLKRRNQRLKKRNTAVIEPVVAIFNGAEGDISADWNRQDRLEALSLGYKLANAILPPLPREVPIAENIKVRYSVQPIADQEFTEIPQDARLRAEPQRKRWTAKAPMIGVAFVGGAEDGRTWAHEIGFIEGVKGIRQTSPRHEIKHQGSKQPVFDLRLDVRAVLGPIAGHFLEDLSAKFIKAKDFPSQVPIGIYTIGEVAIVTVPAEFTTMMGIRAKQAVKDALRPRPTHVELIGLANEYHLYVATPEEYEAQQYEGASTLYGPASGPYFLRLLVDLSNGNIPERIPRADRDHQYRPGPAKKFTLRDIGEPPHDPDDGLEQLLVVDKGIPFRKVIGCRWSDGFPTFGNSSRVTPSVKIVQANGRSLKIGIIPEDDEGLRFVTVALEASTTSSEWVVFWLLTPKMRTALQNKLLMFRIEGIDGNLRHSSAFTVGPQPKRMILEAQ